MEGKTSHSGLLARSPEGHAARGMQIKGNEDVWVEIQANTFRNWVNANLPSSDLRVTDLSQDLCTGVLLCSLVEKLQGRPIRPSWNRRPMNQHHYLENVTCALNAIEKDGVKLVNIGNVDIVNGNLKLILGLIWSLIVRYQIGRSKFPPRKLMLAWLQAVLPDCKVNNLTTDWNSGVLLSALIDYCRPGLFPNWRSLDKRDGIENCKTAMGIAQRDLGIPAVLEPEYLASPWLDELSGMTYLSYFMKPGSPGFYATLRWVNSRKKRPVENFTSDWNDGRAISEVIRSLGGSATDPDKLRTDQYYWESNQHQAIEAGKRLGVQPVLSAKDMADIHVEHLGVMAYAAGFQWVPERPPLHDLITVKLDSTSGRVGEITRYQVTLLDSSLSYHKVTAEIRGPDGKVYPQHGLKHGLGEFVPQKMGMHEVIVFYDSTEVSNKHYFRALPPLVDVAPPGMAPCALGSIVQVLVNATGAPRREDILVTAYSPMGRPLSCPLTTIDGTNTASFKPDEAGEWRIEITYQGNQIQGGPFTCAVFDPNGVVVSGLEGALPMVPHAIDLDCRDVCVPGEVYADIVHDKKSLHTRMERVDPDGFLHRVHFTPVVPGKHRVYVYFNGYDVKGSPFMMRVGTQKRSKGSIHHHLSASPVTTLQAANLNSPITDKNYRRTMSPIFGRSGHISEEYQTVHGSRLTERRLSSPTVDNYIPRASSPSMAPRTQSPTFRPTSPNFRPLSPLRPNSPLLVGRRQHNEYSVREYRTNASSPIPRLTNKEREYDSTYLKSSHLENRQFERLRVDSPTMYNEYDEYGSGGFHSKNIRNTGSKAVKVQTVPDGVVGKPVEFEIDGSGAGSGDLEILVEGGKVTSSVKSLGGQRFKAAFTPHQALSHRVDISFNGETVPVDASQAGEGQLEISINEGEVPNHVQVVGGGRCLVSFTPDHAKPHLIDIKFNGETVRGCPFVCSVTDTSRVILSLAHLELVPVNQTSSFHMGVAGGGAAELAVAVRGPIGELPVKVTGDIHSGFTAEFTPALVGAHQINVDYNGRPVQGTPFVAKAFDSARVTVGQVAKGTVGRPVTFSVDASEAGEGNLEITISARGSNIPTQVHPQGNAKFAVSFVPAEACDHVVNVAFNKRPVMGCPLIVGVGGTGSGPSVTLPGPGPVHRPSTLLINHPGRLEDIEVNVEGPGGQSVPTQVQTLGNGQFRAEFVPRLVGEHRINVTVNGSPTSGSPYSAKVYDVSAIKVKEAPNGVVGKPVTFLVETSQAGPGNLEVTVNGGRVPTSAQAQGPHTYAISFTPRDATAHSVDLRFNGQNVPGSPFKCNVTPAARILSPETIDKVSVGRPCTFSVESPNAPVVEVLGPARRSLPTQVVPQMGSHGKFDVSFNPLDVGDHSVEVRLAGRGHIEGSPFLIKAYDANKVSVTDINDGTVGKPVSFSINASQAGAGNLEIIVAVGGRNVPNFVQSEGNARFKVNFKPTEAAVHTLSVRFNGQAVPGSPFSCKVNPGNVQPRIPVTGNGIELAAVGHAAEIKIEGVGAEQPQVIVTAPTGKILQTKVSYSNGRNAGDDYVATFVPEMVGRHSVAILINDQHVIGSPFNCNVYDVNKVIVSGLPSNKSGSASAEVGKPVTFSVDAAQAGEGTLELVVSTQHTTIKAEVVACARGLYDVTFVPQTSEDHFVNITFNDMNVLGSPFQCTVIESTQFLQVNSVNYFDIPPEHRLEITDSNNHAVKYVTNGNTGKAEFPAAHTGSYQLHLLKNNTLVSSRTVHVFDMSKVDIVNAPEAICHRPAVVTVSVNKVGPGKLSALVKVGPKEIPHSVRQSGAANSHLWEVVFHPTHAAPHRIHLFFNGVPKQPPLEVNVKSPGTEPWALGSGLYQARVGKVTNFHIDTLGRSAREFDVVVSGPLGSAVPVRCYQTKTGKLQAEFTARDIGAHTVEVLHQAKSVQGSPFTCEAFDAECVRIVDIPTVQGNIGERIVFNVCTKNAGTADLDVVATNPLDQHVAVTKTQSQSDLDTMLISLMPTMSGLYRVSVSYGGVPVKNSPLALGVGAVGPTPPPRAVGKGLECGIVGERTSFTVSSVIQPRIQVEAVEGNIDAHIQCPKAGEFIVSYTPKWVGVYDIIISIGPGDLPGSPFRPTVIDPSVVRLIGGWNQYLDETGRLRLPAKLVFDVGNAGPAQLECRVGGRKQTAERTGNRVKFDLSAEGLSAGDADFEMRFGTVRLPELPTTAASSGAQVVLTGKGLSLSQCGEPSTFTIDGSKATQGTPEVTLHAVDTNIPVAVMLSLAGDKIWRATYTTNAPGNYLLTVLWAGRPVKGCPLMVEAKGGADASKVLCSGEGLRQGVVGREIRSWIDTRRAGPGELTAHCTGPRKVAYCELYDHGDATFTLNVKPQEAGRHALTVKYAGQHVPGSPFTLKVAGAPDASKVRVYGPGVEHGVLATFQSRFICDTRGAGAGQLTVRVRGPKGAFRVEMQRESQKDRTILCKYDPTEPGDYRVEVKWANELVPGSPFHVMIFDTQEELRRYINSI